MRKPSKQADNATRQQLEKIWQAWQEWQSAKSFFENAVDPDLIECAVYNLEAKRKHFSYLMRTARDELGPDAQRLLAASGMQIYEDY